MCDAEEGGCGGGEGGQLPPRVPRGSRPTKCMKCKEGSPALIIRVGDAFCKACFKDYFVHKFRATLGKNRCIYPGEKVLLAFSGGPASSSMVRQVQEGLSQEAAKKLRFKPGIIYIDEGAVCGQSLAAREEVRKQVKAILQSTRFPYHLVCLEEVFDLPSSVLHSLSCSITDQCHNYKEAVDGFIKQQCEKKGDTVGLCLQDQMGELSVQDSAQKEKGATSGTETPAFHTKELIKLFGAVKTLTAKEELLQTLRTHLILHVARTNGYAKVMMGDNCTRLAVKLMTNLCLGRGAFLASDTGFLDNRHGDVLFLRPMREYAAKEIAFYNHFFGVPNVFTPALDTKASERASIHHLIESFLYKLQSEFPSTISTVYRTGEKLSVNPRDGNAKEPSELAQCLLCLCSLDTNVVDGSSLQSTLLSEQLCQKLPAASPDGNSCCGGTGNQMGCCRCRPETGDASLHTELLPLLCYSCRRTIKDMKCLESLPPYIHSEAERRRCRAAMKREIQEFLLEEGPEMTLDAPM
ncbi:cytoplasmic tRNA 2-thiolation protein 2 [Sceloporus undulatus]|uniref:cytoplasmic tRNA 2-thiolation protein 2 n=1 Tax=Sceloporus undulatus TaxID=8520 RepID=UPI001C4D30F5|nr:cytoplasmic tRNA 2-thiolation protein 2 [Sceloporus undulatus]